MTADLKEKIARAIVERRKLPVGTYINFDAFLLDAAAALSAIEAAGYVVVPMEPTRAMIEAEPEAETDADGNVWDKTNSAAHAAAFWRAMVEAATKG